MWLGAWLTPLSLAGSRKRRRTLCHLLLTWVGGLETKAFSAFLSALRGPDRSNPQPNTSNPRSVDPFEVQTAPPFHWESFGGRSLSPGVLDWGQLLRQMVRRDLPASGKSSRRVRRGSTWICVQKMWFPSNTHTHTMLSSEMLSINLRPQARYLLAVSSQRQPSRVPASAGPSPRPGPRTPPASCARPARCGTAACQSTAPPFGRGGLVPSRTSNDGGKGCALHMLLVAYIAKIYIYIYIYTYFSYGYKHMHRSAYMCIYIYIYIYAPCCVTHKRLLYVMST